MEGRCFDSYDNLLSQVQPHNIVHLMLLFTHLHLLQGALQPHFTNSRHSLLASPWEIHCGSQCEFAYFDMFHILCDCVLVMGFKIDVVKIQIVSLDHHASNQSQRLMGDFVGAPKMLPKPPFDRLPFLCGAIMHLL